MRKITNIKYEYSYGELSKILGIGKINYVSSFIFGDKVIFEVEEKKKLRLRR